MSWRVSRQHVGFHCMNKFASGPVGAGRATVGLGLASCSADLVCLRLFMCMAEALTAVGEMQTHRSTS